MSFPTTTDAQPGEMPDVNDFAAFETWRNAGGGGADMLDQPVVDEPAATTTEVEPSPEGAEDVPAEGEVTTEGDEELETAPPEELIEQPRKPGRLERRMSALVREVQELRSQLAAGSEEEVVEEVEDAPPAAAAAAPLVAPLLADYEDFDSWRAAYDAYHIENAKREVNALRQELVQQNQQNVERVANAQREQAWHEASEARYPGFNAKMAEAERNGAKVSMTMMQVMKTDPEMGARMALYLADHPDVATSICEKTIARTQAEIPAAMARAGIELAKIVPLLPAAPKKNGAPTTAGPKTPTVIRTASRPPARPRGGSAPPANPVMDDNVARNDYAKWERARERELAAKRN